MMWLHDDVIHDMLYLASIYWKRLIFTDCHEIVMDRPMDRPSYRDARMPLKICSGLFMAFTRFHLLKNINFPCFLWKFDGRNDRRTDWQTYGAMNRRTALLMEIRWSKNVYNWWRHLLERPHLIPIFRLQGMQLTTNSSTPSMCALASWYDSWTHELKSFQILCWLLNCVNWSLL